MEKEFPLAEIEELSHNIFLRWKQSQLALEGFFKNREGEQVLPIMKDSIELFYQYLFISNGNKVNRKINDYLVKPVNVLERLNFIETKPHLYHSYVQLAELFTEQEKLFAKNMALNKIKK
ncbi:YpoC family protein, partial [Bacillus sp. JJ1122]|uniref:YpoC family protein n=1 Tax=Bacillus sp. JJ1122 TaxID=3122951 RepID=UPI002FFE596E